MSDPRKADPVPVYVILVGCAWFVLLCGGAAFALSWGALIVAVTGLALSVVVAMIVSFVRTNRRER